uniref:Uncharacterized protein n=1 Tax=Anguilla anguilla TaxID=7936 RepID=A0A0E9SEZ0_ANGAN
MCRYVCICTFRNCPAFHFAHFVGISIVFGFLCVPICKLFGRTGRLSVRTN